MRRRRLTWEAGLAAAFTGGRASNVTPGVDVNKISFLVGPRYTYTVWTGQAGAADQREQDIAPAEWEAQQNKAAKNRQLKQEQRLQQGDAFLTAVHGGESSASAVSPAGTVEGFKGDTLASGKAESASLSVGRYHTSGLKSWQRFACAAGFS